MSQIVEHEESGIDPRRAPSKFALVGLVFFVTISVLFTAVTSLNALYVTLKWQAIDATVLGYETSASLSISNPQTTFRPIFEVTDQSGNKSRAVSRLGYGSTSGIEIGNVVPIRHNGQGAAISNTFGARFGLPIVGLAITVVLSIALHHTYQNRNAATAALDAGQEILQP